MDGSWWMMDPDTPASMDENRADRPPKAAALT
jgi:hypothetical protein